jgi:hypothetical protein
MTLDRNSSVNRGHEIIGPIVFESADYTTSSTYRSIVFSNCVITGTRIVTGPNISIAGSAIRLRGKNSDVLIQNCTVLKCSALVNVIYVEANATLEDCTITECTSVGFTFIFNNNVLAKTLLKVSRCTFNSNTFTDGNEVYGIYARFCTTVIDGCIIANNASQSNLFAIVANGDYATITNCKILNNAVKNFVGVELVGSNYAYEVSSLSVLGNKALSASAVRLESFNHAKSLSGSLLVQNSAAQHNQGEVYHAFTTVNNGDVPLTFTVDIDNFKSLNNVGTGGTFDMSLCDRSVVQNCTVQNEALAVLSKDLKLSILNNRILYCARSFDIGANTSETKNIVIV